MAASNSRAVAQEVVAAPHYPGRPFTSHVLTRQRGQSALVGIPQTEKEAKYVKCTLEGKLSTANYSQVLLFYNSCSE